jgi:23S rRNA pseudouridine1911/1915/1917 synthase
MELIVERDAGSRLDAFLARQLPELSRSRLQTLIRDQYIHRNGGPAKPRDAVALGDRISVQLPETVPDRALPEDLPLTILYEDEAMVVLDKEAGVVVHPAAGNPTGTLVNALLHHCRGRLSGIGGVERPGIVHRLDKETSGCLVVAKNDHAHQSLAGQFSGRTAEKRYLAVVEGRPAETRGTVFTHLGRNPRNRLKMAVVNPPGGKPSITDYEVLGHNPASASSLVLCHLHTGRTHQIRVHLRHLGCPLIGDATYAKPARQRARTGRMMLHAWKLSLDHPDSGERLHFTAPIPDDFTPWLQVLDRPLT